jgi:hypothetical protein
MNHESTSSERMIILSLRLEPGQSAEQIDKSASAKRDACLKRTPRLFTVTGRIAGKENQ